MCSFNTFKGGGFQWLPGVYLGSIRGNGPPRGARSARSVNVIVIYTMGHKNVCHFDIYYNSGIS